MGRPVIMGRTIRLDPAAVNRSERLSKANKKARRSGLLSFRRANQLAIATFVWVRFEACGLRAGFRACPFAVAGCTGSTDAGALEVANRSPMPPNIFL